MMDGQKNIKLLLAVSSSCAF